MKKQVKKAVTTAQEATNAQSAQAQSAQKPAQIAREAVKDSDKFLADVAEELRSLSSVVRAIFEQAEKARPIDRARVMLIACGDGNADFDASAKIRTAFAKAVKDSARWVDTDGRELKRVRVGADLYIFEALKGWTPKAAFARALRRALGVAVKRATVAIGKDYDQHGKERKLSKAERAREISTYNVRKAERALASAEKRLEDARTAEDFSVIVEGK